MNGLNDSYVESIIRKASSGKLTTGQAAAKLGVSKQYVNRLKKSYATKGAAAFRNGNLARLGRGRRMPRRISSANSSWPPEALAATRDAKRRNRKRHSEKATP